MPVFIPYMAISLATSIATRTIGKKALQKAITTDGKPIIKTLQNIGNNSKKIKNLMIEIDDLKSKQSASLEINEALLRCEINNLKLDLESKSEYLNKFFSKVFNSLFGICPISQRAA